MNLNYLITFQMIIYKVEEEKQLSGYIHRGFWQCMDTLREKVKLEKYWESGDAPWKVWE